MSERTLRGGGGGGGGWRHTMAIFCLLMLASRTAGETETANVPEMTCDKNAPATYTAAVVEYSPELGVTEENIAQRFKDNINAYKEFINAAKKEGADIIVFPECGLATLELPRLGDGSPAMSVDISHIGTNPCIEEDSFHQQEMRDLSCAAREAGVYVVVNLPEHESCSPALAFCPECPGFDRGSVPSGVVACNIRGLRYFNTDVAFDRKGTVIARYRKFNLFGEPGFVAPTKAELSTFMTDFGVRFGMFTCFDLMFERPAVELVAEAGITDLIFPTAWFSELPFLTAIQAQAAWSWLLDVNMLAAGYNLPAVGSTGSGLYAGRRGVVAATMERTRTSKMLVGKLPNARSCSKSDDDVRSSGHTVSLQAYEASRGRSTFLGGDAPPKMRLSKKAMELPKRKVNIPSLYKCGLKTMLHMEQDRHIVQTDTGEAIYDVPHHEEQQDKVELVYKKKRDAEGEGDPEMQADEAEFREALAPRPEGTYKLIHGPRYRSYLKDLMMSRLKSKHERLTEGNAAVFKQKQSATNEEESSEDKEDDNKSFMKRKKILELDDLVFGRRQLQKKSEKNEDDDSEPSIEEIARTMLSGLEEGGDMGEQLKEMVEKLQEDQEKSKLASKRQPSIDEMEGALLGAMRELSGNMTAEGDILGDVMMDLQENEQREAAERKFILERCQRILMDIGEKINDKEEPEEETEDEADDEGWRIITDESKESSLSDISDPASDEDESKSCNENELPVQELQETKIPEVEEVVDKEVKGDEKIPGLEFVVDSEKAEDTPKDELKSAEDAETPDDAIPPQNEDAVESEEEPSPPVEETSEPCTPAVEEYVGTDDEIPSQEDEMLQEEDVEEAEECDDETCSQEELEEAIEQEPLESAEPEESTEQTPSPMIATKIETPATESECSNYVKPEDIKYSGEKFKEKDAFLYLKTEDLQKYASLLLTSQSIIENSTVTVCHGVFCCYFSVTIHPGSLPSPTGFKPSSLAGSAFRRNLDLVPVVKDETHFYAQKSEELRNLVGHDIRGHYSRMMFLEEEEEDFDAEEGEKGDDDELADVDLSEMQPDDEDDDDGDIVTDIHEGPVFLQSAVLQTLKAGEAMGSGSLTQEDMEPSEKIIEEEKKAKEREQKAISEGLIDEFTPSIPEPEQMKEGEDKEQSDEVTAITEEVRKQEEPETSVAGEEEGEPPTGEAETADVEETMSTEEEALGADVSEEPPPEEELAPLKEARSEIQLKEPGTRPEDMEGVSESRVCDCLDCWGGRDEALPVTERKEQEEIEEQGDGESEDDVEGKTKTEKKKQRKRASKRYYYRIVVYNGLRTFDGITDGGLQVCAVISCTGMSIQSCGKLHSDEDNVIPTAFEQVSIRGNFRRNRALPLPTTLGMDMMPLPANSFTLKVVPRRGLEADVMLLTNEELSFITFGIYSRDFDRDPEKSQNIA